MRTYRPRRRPRRGVDGRRPRSSWLGRHKRCGYVLASLVEHEQIGHSRHLEQPAGASRRTDDRELALVAREQGTRAQDHSEAGAVEERDVAEVEDERSDAAPDRGVDGLFENPADGYVHLTSNGEARSTTDIRWRYSERGGGPNSHNTPPSQGKRGDDHFPRRI